MNRDHFPPPPSPQQIREALAAADALDRVLRACAVYAAGQIELLATLTANDLRDWAQRPEGTL